MKILSLWEFGGINKKGVDFFFFEEYKHQIFVFYKLFTDDIEIGDDK